MLDDLSSHQLYHGTKADLEPGDLIAAGYSSNYGTRKKAKYVYLSATLEAATWVPSWPWVTGRVGSTSWKLRERSKTTPI